MKKWRILPSKSIFFHLTIVYLLLGLFPLFTAGVVLYGQFKLNMEQVVLQDMGHMVFYASKNVEEMVEECNNLTKLMYDLNTVDQQLLCQLLKNTEMTAHEKRLEMNIFLNHILDSDSRIRSVFFVDSYGSIYYVTNNTQKVLMEQEYFRFYETQQEDMKLGLQIYHTHMDDYFPGSKNQVITFVRDYKDISEVQTISQVLGRLYIDMDLSKLSAVLQSVGIEQETKLQVLDAQGRCIFSTDAQETGQIIENSVFLEQIERQQIYVDDENYYVSMPISTVKWVVTVSIARRVMLENIINTKNTIIVFLLCSFCVLIYCYAVFLTKFRQPVQQLEEGMSAIQNGDLSARVVFQREDELGLLADGFNHMAQDLEEYIKQVYVAELRQRDAELDALKSQIKPHYLYNTLDVIRMTALENGDEKTASMVESLSRQLKYLIGHHGDLVPLQQEMDNIKEYFFIMKVRYGNRIHLEIDADDEIMKLGIIKLSLQPVVENAVKYGLQPKKGTGTVRIAVQQKCDELEIVVMDDGVGIAEDCLHALVQTLSQEEKWGKQTGQVHHLGLRNVSERIQKNFGKAYGLEIESVLDMGTMVTLHLPVLTVPSESKDIE